MVSSNNSNVSGSETSGGGSTVSAKSCKVKLPKLSLPTFSGDPIAWTTFWESFSSAIHQNADLSDIEKFQYLQSLLQKSAADTIRGLPLTGVNYKEAVDLLQSRYSNKQVIVSSHMETLLQLPKVNTSEELKKLRLVFDKTESVIRSLQGIGITPEMYGTFLTPILMSKIPNDLRLILSCKLSGEWDLKNLMKHFSEELKLREKCAMTSVGGSTKAKEDAPARFSGTKPRIQPATASALHTNYVGQQQGGGVRCIYCRNYHLSASCTTVTDPAARRKILRQKARCFLCLKGGHLSRDCPSQSRCFRCNQRHHVSICQSLQQTKPSLDKLQDVNKHPQTVQSSASARHSVPNSESYGEKVTTGLYLARPHNVSSCTLLQTARATVYSPLNDDVSCQARILFDLGSQKSYVSKALKNQLGLIPIRTDKILLKTFGSNEPILKTCEVVQISIQCQDELKIFIQAYVVDTVCSPISNQFIEVACSNYPHLQSLPLADCNSDHGDLNVQILIGGDFYRSFMQNEVIRVEAGYGPTAVLSRLGYVLSGPVEIPCLNDVTSNFNMFQTMKVETTVLQEDINLKGQLSKFWQLDSLGIIDDIASESDVYYDFNRKIKFNGIRYQVSLPFKEQHTLIPDNYGLC